MKCKCIFLLFFNSLLFFNDAFGQYLTSSQEVLVKNLTIAGFENLHISVKNKSTFIFYEDRVYRFEINGLRKILDEASRSLDDSTNLYIIPLMRGIPVFVFTTQINHSKNYRSSDYDRLVANHIIQKSFDIDTVRGYLKRAKIVSKSFGRIDVIFLPGFKLAFGNFASAFEWEVNMATMIQTSMWKGMLISAQVIIPFHSELQQDGEKKIRMGNILLDQLFRLPKNVFVNASTGIYTYANPITNSIVSQRYGVHTDLKKYFMNSKVCFGGYAGLTGQIRFNNGVLEYGPLDKVTAAVYALSYISKYNLTTGITAGKYLFDDFAVRLNVSRSFGELNIGLFAVKSSFGTNGGINFIIPVSAGKHSRPAAVRFLLANDIKYEYTYRTIHRDADMYDTNTDLTDKIRDFNYVRELK